MPARWARSSHGCRLTLLLLLLLGPTVLVVAQPLAGVAAAGAPLRALQAGGAAGER